MRIDEVHAVAVAAEIELVDDPRMEEADEVRARADDEPLVLEGVLERAGAADSIACLEHQHRTSGSREVGGGGQAVVPGADHDGVPGRRRDAGGHTHARRSVIA